MIAAAKVASIREYSTDSDYEVHLGRRLVRFRNTDSLVSKSDWNIVVQKTGYIHEAGRCLVMQTVIEDRPVVIVLLNSFGKLTRVADARRIRRWVEATMLTGIGTGLWARFGRECSRVIRSAAASRKLSRAVSGLSRLRKCEPVGSIRPSGGESGMTV